MVFINIRTLMALVLLGGALLPLVATDVPAKKLLVLTQFSPGKTGIAEELLADAEVGMKNALVTLGSFDVVSVKSGFTIEETTLLFEKLKALKEGKAAIPDGGLQIGAVLLAKVDVELMHGAAMLVVPILSKVVIDEVKTGGEGANTRYKAKITSVFVFIRLEPDFSLTTRTVETMGFDVDRDRSLADAVSNIQPLFAYELGQLAALTAKTPLLVFEGGEAYIERGREQGVLLGTEYEILGGELDPEGKTVVREKGLLVVNEVAESVSQATVRYADADVKAGDTVREVARFGLDLAPYVHALIPWEPTGEFAVQTGLRVTLSKAVHTLRPLLAIEGTVFPFSVFEQWLVLRALAGLEICVYLGRFEIAAMPMIGIEESFAVSGSAATGAPVFGVRGIIELGLLVTRDMKIFIDSGYDYWFGTQRQGFLAGAGILFKL